MSPEQLQPRAVTLEDGKAHEFNLDLSKVSGPVIFGRVTVNGEVAFKDAVLVTPDQMLSFRSGTVDEQGNFEVTGMKAGSYYLWLADNKWKPRKFMRMPVQVGENDRLEIRRDLRGCRLSGRVVVGDDFDYTTASVQIRADGDDTLGNDMAKGLATFKVACDAEGRFDVPLLVEGRYRVVASAPGHTAVERAIDLARDSIVDLFPGGRAGQLNVKIAALHGDDIAGPLPSSDMARQVLVRVVNAEGREVALSDDQAFLYMEEGSFVNVPSLSPGAYTVLLTGAHIEPFSREVDIRPDEAADIEAELHRGAEVRIKVLNGELDAEDVRKMTVEVHDAAGEKIVVGDGITNVLATTAAGAAGKTLSVNPLKAGVYRIVIKLAGYADAELNVQLDRSRIIERVIRLVR
jgi:hypothetical protein